jgi:hypothetical protein
MKALHCAEVLHLGHATTRRQVKLVLTMIVLAEAPRLTLSDVDIPMDTTETPNGQFREHTSPDGQRSIPFGIASGRAGAREHI